MAKKGVSYGANVALISGQRDVAKSEALKSMAGGAAFSQAFGEGVTKAIEAKAKRDELVSSYIDTLGGLENVSLLGEGENKQVVMDFVRKQRDEYAKLASTYARTKNRDVLDRMEEIKFSFTNLDSQIKTFDQDNREYLSMADNGQLIEIPGKDEKYPAIFTNNSTLSVESNGNMGFTTEYGYHKYKDVAGKYTEKNNISETASLGVILDAKKMGEGGKSFYRDDIKNSLAATFKSTGNTGIMAMALTDLTGDNEYQLPDGRKAGNLSFKRMWADGLLDDKFYNENQLVEVNKVRQEREKTGNKDISANLEFGWMWDKSNVGELNDMMSEYYTDVAESSYNKGKANYKPPSPSGTGKSGKSGKLNLGKSRFGNDYIYMEQQFVNNKLKEFQNAKKGDFIPGFEGANTYGFEFDGKDFIYKTYNSETGEFEGNKKFKSDKAIKEFIPSHYLSGGGGKKLLD